MDLLNAISHKIGFEYEIYTVPDGQAGQKYLNGSWSGVIGELVRGVNSFICSLLLFLIERVHRKKSLNAVEVFL